MATKLKTKSRPPAKQKLSKEKIEQLKVMAYALYVDNGWNQKAISEATGISEQTISAWKLEGNWEEDREEERIGPKKDMRRIRKMLNAKLDEIEAREAPYNFPDSKEADAIHKITDSIKKLRDNSLTFFHKSETGRQYVLYVQKTYGQQKAKEALASWHEYLMATS